MLCFDVGFGCDVSFDGLFVCEGREIFDWVDVVVGVGGGRF